MKVYLDTNLWNALCYRAIDPGRLVATLTARNANLVVGLHDFYELAKNFGSSTEEASERGKRLFSYLREFVDSGVLCAKENDELLAAEMEALKSRTPTIDAFLDQEGYALLSKCVDKLAIGGFDEPAAEFLERQRRFALSIRSVQIQRLKDNPDAKEYLRCVPPEKVERWLQTESSGPVGLSDLQGHILQRFPEATETEAMEYATALLKSEASRAARGIVRAGMYYMWRCAYRDSVPKDLFDDIYHVLNSVHCDIYTTEEKKQTEYAGMLLITHTRVAIYDGERPLDLWLQDLI